MAAAWPPPEDTPLAAGAAADLIAGAFVELVAADDVAVIAVTAAGFVAVADAAGAATSGLPVPRFVSLKTDRVHVRGGPDKDHDVAFIYTRVGWPVEITAEFENWRRIRDSDGTEGWVYHSLLSGKRMAVVQLKSKTDLAPLYATSGGKAILAHMPSSFQKEYLGRVQFERATPKTIHSVKVLRQEIEKIRAKGIAYSLEEWTPGIVGIGVPVLDPAGEPLGAINVAIPASRFNPEIQRRAEQALIQIRDDLLRQLLVSPRTARSAGLPGRRRPRQAAAWWYACGTCASRARRTG